ncbi:hypothetical protein J7I84_12520 [Arthrobacter sp. ISL-85]|uniref:hypothetical protein n=1 Tax=Arthrobacter sp. ISL-85 TaxID=2819115 RepID=UPI001BE904DF|nr:hypothetical protein [Arthrobacter sp. ISL-85]MBT2567305.1 hypothetical protein [Arthrobacter sp. ISL-85]
MAIKMLAICQEITEIWPGFWEYDRRVYHSLDQARMVRAATNGNNNYEADNHND